MAIKVEVHTIQWVISGILGLVVIASIGWMSSFAEEKVDEKIDLHSSRAIPRFEKLEEKTQQHDTAIALLKLDLTHVKETVDDTNRLVKLLIVQATE